jgi:hypothetical protein
MLVREAALFTDSRARIVVGDGRHVLLAEPTRYDDVVSDLRLDPHERVFVDAGHILYRAFVALAEGNDAEAARLRDAFRDLLPYGTFEMFSSRLASAGAAP